MAVDEDTNETSFYKDPPPHITGVTLDDDGTVKPIVKDSEVLTTPCCSRKV